MRYEIYEARDGWRWRLRHRNGNIISESGEAYTTRSDARRAVRGHRIAAAYASIAVVEDEADK